MTNDELKSEVIARSTELLTQGKHRNTYICPVCGKEKLSTKDNIHFTCWYCESGEERHGKDIIQIIGEIYRLDGYIESLNKAAELLGINRDATARKIEIPKAAQAKPEVDEKETDYTQFFLQANSNLNDTSYRRGISEETLNRFKVGYVASWRHPNAPETASPSPRLIIPTSKYSYLARDTRRKEEIPDAQKDYDKSKVGKVRTFNAAAMERAKQPIYIVEGEIDAMSIIDVGGEAIGLGSINYLRIFFEAVDECKPTQPFIIALDNETDEEKREKVEKAVNALKAGFDKRGMTYYEKSPFEVMGCKDANEALNKDREAFAANVKQIAKEIQDAETGVKKAVENFKTEQEKAEYEKAYAEISEYNAAGKIKDLKESIQSNTAQPTIKTGFNELDKKLEDGLHAALYVIGATTGMGKTLFCLQMADQIAAVNDNGQSVLIFSLEMSSDELMARSVSRETFKGEFKAAIEKGEAPRSTAKKAKTTYDILLGKRYENYSEDEISLIGEAFNAYEKYASRIYIVEGMADITVEQIEATVEKFIKVKGAAPVVMIDYLQILMPSKEGMTDKQNIDRVTKALKRMSRDFKTPVIAISSFNRESYKPSNGSATQSQEENKLSAAAFKESGLIEYGADMLIGLQYTTSDEARNADSKQAKGEATHVTFQILKSRNGEKGKVPFLWYPKFNYCQEDDDSKDNNTKTDWYNSSNTI